MCHYAELIRVFFRMGIYSFGPSASQVLMAEIVDKKRWLTAENFAGLVSLAALVPGPMHVNLTIATGYRLRGFGGSLIAVFSFILPGSIIALLISQVLRIESFRTFLAANPGIITGLLCAVAGLLITALARLTGRLVTHQLQWLWLASLTALLYFVKIPVSLIIVCSGLLWLLPPMRRIANPK